MACEIIAITGLTFVEDPAVVANMVFYCNVLLSQQVLGIVVSRAIYYRGHARLHDDRSSWTRPCRGHLARFVAVKVLTPVSLTTKYEAQCSSKPGSHCRRQGKCLADAWAEMQTPYQHHWAASSHLHSG